MTLNATARLAALSALVVGLVGAACSDDDNAPPEVLGAQWFDPNEGEATVETLDLPPPQDVVDESGGPVPFGASVTLAPNVAGIQILFSEPLNADVIETLTINGEGGDVDVPVDVENGILNHKSKYNPGVIDFTGRTGLVEIVDATTGEVYQAIAEYLNNGRANESITFKDVGISLTPVKEGVDDDGEFAWVPFSLPTGSEFQIRVYADEIKDRDGNVLRAAIRTAIPAEGGRAVDIGQVAGPDGRPIAAVAIFATDLISVAAVTGPALPDADANPSGLAIDDPNTADDPDTAGNQSVPTFTFQREDAILVEFNTDIDVASTASVFRLFDEDGNEIAVTVQAAQTGDRFELEDDGTRALDEDSNFIPLDPEDITNAVEVIPAAPLAGGDYELRIDAGFADTFGNDDPDARPQIFPFTVE